MNNHIQSPRNSNRDSSANKLVMSKVKGIKCIVDISILISHRFKSLKQESRKFCCYSGC
ncbi:uncharacterized protein PgNI_08789 [Pyricularia grisea]|uniref:Uncharacterized protein n=1 Tax=Pyricularia grisea TaxID=148305 RepID=A0A6P8AUV7_PYRGI|nr:uncharacterized protein PgNI_08789 [Pyricularia grisea]TLD05997.1 hypothetical protein PgNI_08789 [Pyricularia grisea]